MSFFKNFLLTIILSAFSLLVLAQDKVSFTHVVKPGETLYGISSKYGVTVESLKSCNVIVNNGIVPGQKIKVLVPEDGRVKHRVSVGETLYAISRFYGLTVDDITKENPQLKGASLKPGDVIVVPFSVKKITEVTDPKVNDEPDTPICRLMYEVQKKETVYSICRKFDLTEEEFYAANPILLKKKLKKKQIVCIPFKKAQTPVEVVVNEVQEDVKAYKIAMILPFNLGKEKVASVNLKMLDFYEGFLMSLERYKNLGFSAEVYAYDEVLIDSLGMPVSLLDELKTMDLIVGPYSSDNLQRVISCADENNINMVVPFSSKANYTEGNASVYQLNVPQQQFYSKVYDLFMEQNKDKKIIFLLAGDNTDNTTYYKGFREVLDDNGVVYNVISAEDIDELSVRVDKEVENVFVPVSTSEKTFRKLVKKFDDVNISDSVRVSVFGQPNWQQFMKKHRSSFVKYNCSFFTKFIYDSSDMNVINFEGQFESWFRREQYASYPMYGLMGYDLGEYFFNLYNVHGDNATGNVLNNSVNTIQTPIFFEREKNKNGYANNQVIFVKFNLDGNIIKSTY